MSVIPDPHRARSGNEFLNDRLRGASEQVVGRAIERLQASSVVIVPVLQKSLRIGGFDDQEIRRVTIDTSVERYTRCARDICETPQDGSSFLERKAGNGRTDRRFPYGNAFGIFRHRDLIDELSDSFRK